MRGWNFKMADMIKYIPCCSSTPLEETFYPPRATTAPVPRSTAHNVIRRASKRAVDGQKRQQQRHPQPPSSNRSSCEQWTNIRRRREVDSIVPFVVLLSSSPGRRWWRGVDNAFHSPRRQRGTKRRKMCVRV